MKEKNIGIKPIKILWMRDGQVLHISFASNEKEAEKKITESRDRRWGTAMLLFWSGKLGRYVTIPEN